MVQVDSDNEHQNAIYIRGLLVVFFIQTELSQWFCILDRAAWKSTADSNVFIKWKAIKQKLTTVFF